MDLFSYKNGELYAENVPVREIAAKVGTPFYCYSEGTIRRHYGALRDAFPDMNVNICFAMKANSNIAILRILKSEGSGADVVSQGEIMRALKAGIAPNKIIFSGIGKTREEITFAAKAGILQLNVESEPELKLISDIGTELGLKIPVAIRVNPDVTPSTHGKINTGKKESKFGIAIHKVAELVSNSMNLQGIQIKGLSIHIGSQILDFHSFSIAFDKIASLIKEIELLGIALQTLDLGGGIGIRYGEEAHPDLHGYSAIVRQIFSDFKGMILLEPGRVMVGNAGIMVTETLYIKHDGVRKFVIVDAGLNDLIRPSMYDAYHEIIPVTQLNKSSEKEAVDIVGPVCESGDIFAEQRQIHLPEQGDLLAFRTAGAYGAVMSSTYNSRLLIPEVLVNGSNWAVIRPRMTYESMLAMDKVPDWL